jgi:hypothetical protein
MPTYFARKAGNINAADVWATTPSGTAAAVTFASGDVLVANSFTITVNVSTDLGGAGQVRNDTTGGATAGGTFALSNGVTLTANAFGGSVQGVHCVNANNLTVGQVSSFVGNLTNGTGAADMASFGSSGAGTVNITGNLIGGAGAGGRNFGAAVSGPTTINFTGNITGGSGANGVSEAMQLSHALAVLNFLGGNITGGTGGGGTLESTANFGLKIISAASVNITGNVVGGGIRSAGTGQHAGLFNASPSAVVTINGNAIGGAFFPGVQNSSTGTVRITKAVGNAYGPGNTSNLASAVGATNTGIGVIEIEQLEFGTFGQSPTSGGGIRLKKLGSNVAVFNYCDTEGAKTLIDATQNAAMPAANHVRSGLSYAGGAATGTLAVPLPSQVAVGVATDNTTGTAFVTGSDIATAVWGAATRSITGGTVDTLTNAPSVPTPAQIASQVRTELAVELGRVDAAVSSRLAPNGTLATVTTLTNAPSVPTPSEIASQVRAELATELARVDAAVSTRLAGSSYTAPANSDISAIKAKTDLLNTDRLAQVSTVSTNGAQLAAALS